MDERGREAAVVMPEMPPVGDGPMAAPVPSAGENTPAEARLFTFSLSRPAGQVLPVALVSAADGEAYPIDPDFRTVLACLRRLSDPALDALAKLVYLGRRFYRGKPPRDMAALFTAFVAGGGQAGDGPPLIDFEQDAGAVYASFRMQYGIDLLHETLHWFAFRELLAGLGENTPLGLRVRVRAMPERDLPPEERAQLRKLRERFAIAPRADGAEQALVAELDRRLAAGEDPAEVLQKLDLTAGG